ncbi:DUF488 family protein [Orbus sturtevantii]|uniref:DUF488 domain-containing protein n=1 Tax=Orbus sturtevantii TaxID=3074109 RepID=UPI00370D3A70
MSLITLKRVYEKALCLNQDSYLIDRLWPRGISKAKLTGVAWLKEVAPSNELRQWYHAHLDQWDIFYQQYQQELKNNPVVACLYQKLKDNKPVTLLYGSKDLEHNHAIVLRDFLLKMLKQNNSAS